MAKKIDKKDIAILQLLQEDAKITNLEISKRVKLAPSAALERIRKLKRRGYFKGFYAKIDERKFNLNLLSFALVRTTSNWTPAVEKELEKIPYVLEIHQVAGEFDFLIKIRSSNTEHLAKLMRDDIGGIEGVSFTNALISLKTVKETIEIPLINEHK